MNADEAARVESRLERPQSPAMDIPLACGMHGDIVADGLDPLDVDDSNEERAVVAPDEDAVAEMRGPLGEKRGERSAVIPLPRERATDAVQRVGEAAIIHRFQQVVERMPIKRADGIRIKRSDEDSQRHPIDTDRLHDLQAAHLRHLNIKEDDVGAFAFDALHRFDAVRAFANHLEIRSVREQLPHSFAGERLIVDDDGLNHVGSARNEEECRFSP